MRISDWSSDVCSSDLLAGDVVDAAGQEVRGQRGGVLDGPDDDALELRLLAPPGRVGLEHDMRAGLDLGHAIGADLAGRATVQIVEAHAERRERLSAGIAAALRKDATVRAVRPVSSAALDRKSTPSELQS